MKKLHSLFIVLGVAIVIIALSIFLGMKNTSIENSAEEPNQNPPVESQVITLDELAQHNTEEDCWVIYKGKVYDLTDWLGRHPGGVRTILPHCGTENFEEAFIKKHGTSKSDLFMKVAVYMGDTSSQGTLQ